MIDSNNGTGMVSLDPDDAVAAGATLEDSLRAYQPGDGESRVYSINPCYYLISSLTTSLSLSSNYPKGHIIACCVELGLDNIIEKLAEPLTTIQQVRIDISLRGGDWMEKEFLHGKLVVDFHTSKVSRWSVRCHEAPMTRCDNLATGIGIRLHHMRQIAILSGMVQSVSIEPRDQHKMVQVLKWWYGVLREKAEVAAKISASRLGKPRTPLPLMEDPWSEIMSTQ